MGIVTQHVLQQVEAWLMVDQSLSAYTQISLSMSTLLHCCLRARGGVTWCWHHEHLDDMLIFMCPHESRPPNDHLPTTAPSFQMPFQRKLCQEWTSPNPHDRPSKLALSQRRQVSLICYLVSTLCTESPIREEK